MEFKFVRRNRDIILYACDESFFSTYYDKNENKWVKGVEMARSYMPYAVICTSNYNERELHKALMKYNKAKCLKTWTRGNTIDDPYGRMVKVGTINCSIWDLREAFGITEPLEKFLDYEMNAFLKGEINSPMY